MEGGGDSETASVMESTSLGKYSSEGHQTEEHVDGEVKEEQGEDVIENERERESLNDGTGDMEIEDSQGQHLNDSSKEDVSTNGIHRLNDIDLTQTEESGNGNSDKEQQLSDLSQEDGNINEIKEDFPNHRMSCHGDHPSETSCQDTVEEPRSEIVQSDMTDKSDHISHNAIPESDKSRTSDTLMDGEQPNQASVTPKKIELVETGQETATCCADTETKTSSLKASFNCNPSKSVNYSSPEAFLLSISKDVSDDSQLNIPVKTASESHSRLAISAGMKSPQIAENREKPKTRTKEEAKQTQRSELSSEKLSRIECTSVQSARTAMDQDDDLLSELDAELDDFSVPQTLTEGDPINGLLRKGIILEDIPQFKMMKLLSEELQQKVDSLHGEIKSMQQRLSSQQKQVSDLEQEKDALQMNIKQAESVQSVHLLRVKELELLIDQQKVEIAAAKERQQSHDSAAKKAITQLQQEMSLRVDQVKSMYEEAIKEKEAIVMKYAKSEKEVSDQKKLRETLEKTVESLKSQLHDIKKERSKLKNTAASKETEASYLQKEVDQLKEEVSSQGIKVKWAQNKLKTELDAHKETKVKLAKTEQRLTEAKEETEQIRKNCQEMIKTYQTSEEVKSNSLDKQLKVKHSELEQKLQEQKDHLEVHQARLRELESLKKNLADNVAELDSFKVKNKCLETERLQNEELLAKFKELLNSQKEENRRLNKQLEEKKTLAQELDSLKQTEQQLRSEVSGQKNDQSDLEMELETRRQKEGELLQFTEKITSKNTSLSSENTALRSKASQLESAALKLQKDLDELQTSYNQLSSELKQEHQFRERESSLLTSKLNEKSRALEQLSIQLDEARDDNKTLKRKHAANTKDLTRQLQQAHKRLESIDSSENPSRDTISVGSRTSSSGSLDTLPGSTPSAVNSSGSSVSVSTSASSKPEEHPAPHDHTVAIATGNDYPGVDKGMLVDRIVRLQKAHQRKNEKMEFMQEHISHLVEELKKKSKIIQQYIMRDEAGALVPVSSDVNKAQMSKQGGIMSSLYRSQSTDPSMTLDLSLEINRKLQAVLEDTLLKNITLKENIETLGQEIARLLKEQQKHHSGHR
ncbi:coiled-coil domain-containing protein 186-like isoform X2 [Patiria miniata]|uniref:Coiled-coil domain-containing protein 186 n=1 Tax=Patiria miniata TaxID=46514 RepID=A0A913Z154_PATMI|nr:coiled-coil domain-containing protein 186-like isoform X2 [Patiria miniata]